MEEPELHPVVQLIIKRMESHPEEFHHGGVNLNRWWHIIDSIREFARDHDKKAFDAAYAKLRMDALYEEAVDELMNGDERRAEEMRQAEEDKRRYAQQSQVMQSIHQSKLTGAIQNPYLNAAAGAQALNYPRLSAAYDPITDTYGLGGTKLTADQVADNPGLISSMKKALGL